MNSLLNTLLNNRGDLSKTAAAELIKANASQLLQALTQGGLDPQSAKTLIEHFTTSLLMPGKPAETSDKQTLLSSLVRHFASLPDQKGDGAMQQFKKGVDTIVKQILHHLAAKPSAPLPPGPVQTYNQNQLLQRADISASLTGSLQDTEHPGEAKEKRDQHLFGLAENKNSDQREGKHKGRRGKGENMAEMIQILLSIRQSLKNTLQALLAFQKQYSAAEALRLLPDLEERIRFVKEQIRECDGVLKQLY